MTILNKIYETQRILFRMKKKRKRIKQKVKLDTEKIKIYNKKTGRWTMK